MYMFQCYSLSSSHRLLPCPVSTNLLSIVFVSKAALQIVHQYHLSRFHNGYIFSCVWLCDPLDYSLSGSSVHGIFQARILEWVTISFYRGSSWPRDWIHVFYVSCIAGGFFTCWAMGEAAGHTLGWDIISPQKRSLKRSTCIPVADSFWCLAKLIQCFKFKKKKKRQWHKVTII